VPLAEARVAFEPGERVVSIGGRAITAVPQGNGVALFTATTVVTSRGREITGVSRAFLVDASVGRRRAVTVAAVSLARRQAAVARLGLG